MTDGELAQLQHEYDRLGRVALRFNVAVAGLSLFALVCSVGALLHVAPLHIFSWSQSALFALFAGSAVTGERLRTRRSRVGDRIMHELFERMDSRRYPVIVHGERYDLSRLN